MPTVHFILAIRLFSALGLGAAI